MSYLTSRFLIIVAAVCFVDISAFGQATNTDFKIVKIEPSALKSPTYSGPELTKGAKGAKAKIWLVVEVTFAWQPRVKDPKYTDELTFNYYILFKNKLLLVGSVTHTGIPQEKDMHSVAYVSPQALERFLEPKDLAKPDGALLDVGVTIAKQGQQVASASWHGTGDWWPKLPQIPGFVLNKSETPFAPLAWDYYEAIKPKAAGQ
jgi:hypothetical protein